MAIQITTEPLAFRRFVMTGAAVGLFVLASLNCWLVTEVPLDDAFVYFRYAQNHAAGFGPVFNLDEAVEGYSSVLWMMLLNTVAAINLPLPWSAQFMSIASYLATLALIVGASRMTHGLKWMAPLHFAASLAPAMWAGMALETSFFSLLVLASVLACLRFDRTREERTCVGILLVALALARPEGIVLSCALLAFLCVVTPPGDLRGRLRHMSWYFLPFLLWIFFLVGRYHFYGHLQPNTYYVKVGNNLNALTRGARYLIDFLNSNSGTAWLLPLMAIYGAFFRRDRRWWILIISVVTLCLTTVMSGGNNWPYWRYAMPLFPLVTLLVAEFFSDGWGLTQGGGRKLGCVGRCLVVYLLCVFILARTLCAGLVTDRLISFVAGNRDFQSYAEFHGRVYRAMLRDTQSIALNPMPFVSAHFDGPIIDMLGLVDEHIAHRPMAMGRLVHSHEKGDGEYVLERRPTIILFRGGLDFSPTPPRYPNPKDLYFVSDVEIAVSPLFRELYEPLAVWVPLGRGYLDAFKLRKEALTTVDPSELDSIYVRTIGRARTVVPLNLQLLSSLQKIVEGRLQHPSFRVGWQIVEMVSP